MAHITYTSTDQHERPVRVSITTGPEQCLLTLRDGPDDEAPLLCEDFDNFDGHAFAPCLLDTLAFYGLEPPR